MKPYLLLFVLQFFYQQSFSAEVCVNHKYVTFKGVNDQNVSVKFSVAQSLRNTQNLRWTKDGSTLIGIYHSSGHDFMSSVRKERYTLVEGVQNNTFEISIEFAQENDSGIHTIYVDEGARSFCVAFELDLRIYNTDPTCNAICYRTTGMVEMSCHWMQVDKGDYADIVAGEIVVSTETGMNYLGYVYKEITNIFSVYVTKEKLLAGNEFPFKCLVFHRQLNTNKTCEFPTMMQHTIWNKQTEQLVFERCIPSEIISSTWWYSVDGEVLPLEFTKNYTLPNIHHIYFLYGEEDNHSNLILHNMDKLNYIDYRFGNVSFLAESSNNHQRAITFTRKPGMQQPHYDSQGNSSYTFYFYFYFYYYFPFYFY